MSSRTRGGTAAIGLSVGAFVALIALHGKPFFEALLGVPKVIQAFSSTLFLGAGSFFISLMLAIGVWGMAVRHLPESRHQGWGKDFYAEFLALATGVGIMLLQSLGEDRGNVLQALLLGAMAGFVGPWVGKGTIALKDLVFVRSEDFPNDPNGPAAGGTPMEGGDEVPRPEVRPGNFD